VQEKFQVLPNQISDMIKRDLDGLNQQPIEKLLENYRKTIDPYTNELR